MRLLGGKILKPSPEEEAQIDFTPVGASIYEVILIRILIMNVKGLNVHHND